MNVDMWLRVESNVVGMVVVGNNAQSWSGLRNGVFVVGHHEKWQRNKDKLIPNMGDKPPCNWTPTT